MKFLCCLLIAVFLLTNHTFIYASVVALTDDELDEISAAGFTINTEAVIALRQAVVSQYNLGVTEGAVNTASNITNSNFAVVSDMGSAQVKQNNLGCVIARSGDIKEASVNNLNEADIDAPAAIVNQVNMAILAAPRGRIIDSKVSNINRATFSEQALIKSTNQVNIAIFIAREVSGVEITRRNEVVDGPVTGLTVLNPNSFAASGLNVVINSDNALVNQAVSAVQQGLNSH